jgi:DNA repair protein RadA/Sms
MTTPASSSAPNLELVPALAPEPAPALEKYICVCCRRLATNFSPRCAFCAAHNAIRPRAIPKPGMNEHSFSGGPGGGPLETFEGAHYRPTKMTIRTEKLPRVSIGVENIDKAFGGGIVTGSAIFLSGDSGAGKSTLSLLLVDIIGDALYAASEESAEQIQDRATRLGRGLNIPLFCSSDLDAILGFAPEYGTLLIDSLHMLRGKPALNSRRIIEYCRATKSTVICVAHRTHAGHIAGGSSIPYHFDVDICLEKVLNSNGDTVGRLIRTGVKNRFGPSGSWPLLMNEHGWTDPADPEDEP